eukprot:CAMPEP_0171325280 /NCGR_PEP_ID=MMETSP0816-20121228/116716_1 /TAXON_ID=420281 /ORGANISM="Proboscia inermis, Strain CCAP1064/1" /LENGTH=54 /DNA_ID=CAMNT_0011824425 /DNA_START=528 /DNA_END=692 /DNA_ORIENTATION=-
MYVQSSLVISDVEFDLEMISSCVISDPNSSSESVCDLFGNVALDFPVGVFQLVR